MCQNFDTGKPSSLLPVFLHIYLRPHIFSNLYGSIQRVPRRPARLTISESPRARPDSAAASCQCRVRAASEFEPDCTLID